MCQGLGFLYTQSGQYYMTLPHIDISDWLSWRYLTEKHTTNLHVHHHKIYDAHRLKENNLTNPYIHVEFPHWDNRLRLDWDYENYDEDRHWLNKCTFKQHAKAMTCIADKIISENKLYLNNLEKILVTSHIQLWDIRNLHAEYYSYSNLNINRHYQELKDDDIKKQQYENNVEQYQDDLKIFTSICNEKSKLIIKDIIQAINKLHNSFTETLGNSYKVHRFDFFYDELNWSKYFISQLIETQDIYLKAVRNSTMSDVPF